jgi:hypothetical protein
MILLVVFVMFLDIIDLWVLNAWVVGVNGVVQVLVLLLQVLVQVLVSEAFTDALMLVLFRVKVNL